VHQDGPAGLAIAARTSDLLVICLQAARQRHVDHRANVRLVDTHAERDGCHHHLDLAVQELLLHVLAAA
jgi:hypothetical protein